MGSLEACPIAPISIAGVCQLENHISGGSGMDLIHRLRIKQLAPEHEGDFRDLLLGLDRISRFGRFAGTVSDSGLARHSRLALSTAAWIAGAFVDERLRGVAELYRNDGSRHVEAAFVVAQGWRGQGLGSALLHAAMQWAAGSERTTLRMIFSRCNWPMRKLASKAGARLDLVLDEIVADVALGPGSFGGVDQI